jgi:hypothetical protein
MSSPVRSALLLTLAGALTAGWAIPAAADISEDDARNILEIVHFDADTLNKLKKKYSAFQTATASPAPSGKTPIVTKQPKAKGGTADPPPGPSASNPVPAPSKNLSECPGLHFLLRDSWSDAGVLGCPTDVKKATGASISYSDDYVAQNKNWAAKGMAAIAYSQVDLITPGFSPGQWFDKSVAFYVEDNSSFNSKKKLASTNSDSRTAGFSGELGYAAGNDYQFVRITPNVTQDVIKNTTAVAVMGEYIPALSSYGFWTVHHEFGDGLNWQFDPDIKLQYASTTNTKNPLQFSGKSQSFRIGPDLTVLLQPFVGGTNDFWDRIGLNTTFHPWYEAYNGHGSYWWTTAVNYRLDTQGNVGLKFSYNRGLDENTGTMTNQYLVSLAGKL